MKKIPALFEREQGNALNIINPECQWVIDGEGWATEKYDGTSCMIRVTPITEGIKYELFKRLEIDLLKISLLEAQETLRFVLADPERLKKIDVRHLQGWIPIDPESNNDKWHREGFDNWLEDEAIGFGVGVTTVIEHTYELVGPRINGNPHRVSQHLLWEHGNKIVEGVPRTYEALKEYFEELANADVYCEGIVWWHEDGRKAKLRVKDFKGVKGARKIDKMRQKANKLEV